jgi:hypothetical protein
MQGVVKFGIALAILFVVFVSLNLVELLDVPLFVWVFFFLAGVFALIFGDELSFGEKGLGAQKGRMMG